MKSTGAPKKHLVIPDCQIRPGDNTEFLRTIGNYIVEKRPDTIICLGDFADMPSLSSYDKGKRMFEGRRYKADVQAAQQAMGVLLEPLWKLQREQRAAKQKQYKPQMHLCYGNHEHRIERATNEDPMLHGTIGLEDLEYEKYGWTTHPFLVPVSIDGVVYCHYLVSGAMGRPIATASAILAKRHQSAVVGHQQGRQTAYASRADGKQLCAIIAGSCYEHDEDYMGPQGNKHWRGIVVLHEVNDGVFDEMFVSLDYLKRKYK